MMALIQVNGGKEVKRMKVNEKAKLEVCVEIENLNEIEEKLAKFNELVKEANSLAKEMASTALEIKLKGDSYDSQEMIIPSSKKSIERATTLLTDSLRTL